MPKKEGERNMPRCPFRGCKSQVGRLGDLCEFHRIELLDRFRQRLPEEHSQFLLEHLHGCVVRTAAKHLKVTPDTIDRFLTDGQEHLTYGGPLHFLDQRLLVRVLLNAANLQSFNEKLAPVASVPEETPVADPGAVSQPELHRKRLVSPPKAEVKPEGYLSIWDLEIEFGINHETARRWMSQGLIACKTSPFGEDGKVSRWTTRDDLIRFVRVGLTKNRLKRQHELFRKILAETEIPEPEQPSEQVSPPPRRRYGGLSDGELNAVNVAHFFEISHATVHRWMKDGFLPFESRRCGGNGRTMKVILMSDLITFVRSCFGNPSRYHGFARYGGVFSRFLREHSPREAETS